MTAWTVVVPVKSWSAAKSRLTELSTFERAGLARALAHDTVETVLDTPSVQHCIVVGEAAVCVELAELGARTTFTSDSAGLAHALTQGRLRAAQEGAEATCLLVADLPLLTPRVLDDALCAVPTRGAGVVRDLAGTGTVMLAARRGPLRPAFGPDSASRHLRTGAVDLSDRVDTRLRRDLDTPVDFAALVPRSGSRVAAWLRRSNADEAVPVSCPSGHAGGRALSVGGR